MFNKYQRDQQVRRVQEAQKRRLVSGYLRDEIFDTSPSVQRIMASPRRADQSPDVSNEANTSTSFAAQPNATGTSQPPTQKPPNPNASQADLNVGVSAGAGLMSDSEGLNGSSFMSAEAARLIQARSKRTNDLANRSRQRMQGWLSTVGQPQHIISQIESIEQPLKSRIHMHSFRDEHEQRHISPEKFQVRLKYQTPKERLAQAQAQANTLLSSGENMSTRKPFVFRAHQPLKSTTKGFQFKPITEQDRIKDKLRTNELFETDQFDRNLLVKKDLHRTATKTRWISPKDFNVQTRKQDHSLPVSTRHSIMKDGMMDSTMRNFSLGPEPYEDPKLEPDFVRTTREYLKQSLLKGVETEIKREQDQALKRVGQQDAIVEQSDAEMSSRLSFVPTHALSKVAGAHQSSNRVKHLSQTQRKPLQRATPTNAYFDTYQKMNSLMQTLQSSSHQKNSKPSLKNIGSGHGINISQLRTSNLDSIYGGAVGQRQSSLLTREIAVRQTGSRESQGENRVVNFSLDNTGMQSPSNATTSPKSGQEKLKNASPPRRNFKLQAKQSYEKHMSRQANMVDTLDSFFDTNKIYLKSVQQEATLRGKARALNEDPLYEEPLGEVVNKQAY